MYSIESLNPDKFALVLLDLQRGYCDPASDCGVKLGWDVSGADAVCRAHVPFLGEVRKLLKPQQIIWFQMEEHPDSIAPNLRRSGGFLCEEEALCVQGTDGHDFHIVKPETGEPVFQKVHPSGFASAAFAAHLAQQGITQLAITGVIGSRCVNATIIGASDRGFDCIALTDLIGGPSRFKEEMEVQMKIITHLYALPLTSAAFVEAVKARQVQPASINRARS